MVLSRVLARSDIAPVHIAITARRYWRLLRTGGHLMDENLSLVLRTCVFTLFLLASSV